MKRIVIADDSATARMFIRRCLEIVGGQENIFVEVENGREALDCLKKEPADLVVADLNMPVMDGETLLKWIKASPRFNSIPVLIITSAVNPAKEKELADMGAYTILAKPVSPAGLAPVIGPLLDAGKEEPPLTDNIDNLQDNMNHLQETMAAAVIETLENMTFMEVVQTDQPASPQPKSDMLKASILVHDPFQGELRLVMPRKLTATIAETLYQPGDQQDIDNLLFDVVAELLNTIAGRVLAEIVSHERTFRIGLPETGIESFEETDVPLVRCDFETEGHSFSLMVCSEALPGISNSKKNIRS
ncbi:MAG: response regulator [Desulfobulbaceae bacterium]|nr:response regulator [Desulfobulbaceae bacterium]